MKRTNNCLKRTVSTINITNWLITELITFKLETNQVKWYTLKEKFLNVFDTTIPRRLYDVINCLSATGIIAVHGRGKQKSITLSCFFCNNSSFCYDHDNCSHLRTIEYVATPVTLPVFDNNFFMADTNPVTNNQSFWNELDFNYNNDDDFLQNHWLYEANDVDWKL